MKLYLITILDNINFGTYLQAFSTAYKMRRRDYDVHVVNYIRPYLRPTQVALNYFNKDNWSYIKRFIYCIAYISLEFYMRYNLKRFISKKINLTIKCENLNQINKVTNDADILLTGSDQVWNSSHNHGLDLCFFWAGINKPKFSYASSIGMENFLKDEQEIVKELLDSYSIISVREDHAKKLLNSLGVKDVCQVLDPTLLLDKKEWHSYCIPKFKKTESYLLIYSVEPKRNLMVSKQAQIIAKERGLKIYVVSPSFKFKKDFNADRVFNFASVELFLTLFYNADFIVASSFHGTAFSINFNKEFITISSSDFNSRIYSLLTLFNLTERCVVDELITNDDLKPIDYELVNSILDVERNKSEVFLDKIRP